MAGGHAWIPEGSPKRWRAVRPRGRRLGGSKPAGGRLQAEGSSRGWATTQAAEQAGRGHAARGAASGGTSGPLVDEDAGSEACADAVGRRPTRQWAATGQGTGRRLCDGQCAQPRARESSSERGNGGSEGCEVFAVRSAHSQDRSCGSHCSSAELALHLDGVRIAGALGFCRAGRHQTQFLRAMSAATVLGAQKAAAEKPLLLHQTMFVRSRLARSHRRAAGQPSADGP